MKRIFPSGENLFGYRVFSQLSRYEHWQYIFISQTSLVLSLCIEKNHLLRARSALEKHVVVAWSKLIVDTLFQNSLHYLFHSFQRPHSSVKKKKKELTMRKEQISFSDSQSGVSRLFPIESIYRYRAESISDSLPFSLLREKQQSPVRPNSDSRIVSSRCTGRDNY